MSRIKHPIRAIEEPFGKAGLVVAVVALVLALTGAAFAATGLNGKQKKEVEKIAKKFAGKPGAPGANGANGKDGANGTNGAPGANGTSATTESFSGSKTVGSVTCTEGGVVVKSASGESAVCNGKKGTNGKDGETGFTETLPSEKTETGEWVVSATSSEDKPFGSISFSIPLAAPLSNQPNCGEPGEPTCQVHYVSADGKTENAEGELAAVPECPGSYEEPQAEPGNLCVYQALQHGMQPVGTSGFPLARAFIIFQPVALFNGAQGANTSGALVDIPLPNEEETERYAFGSWAVTAP